MSFVVAVHFMTQVQFWAKMALFDLKNQKKMHFFENPQKQNYSKLVFTS